MEGPSLDGMEKWYNKFRGRISGDVVSSVGERFGRPITQ